MTTENNIKQMEADETDSSIVVLNSEGLDDEDIITSSSDSDARRSPTFPESMKFHRPRVRRRLRSRSQTKVASEPVSSPISTRTDSIDQSHQTDTDVPETVGERMPVMTLVPFEDNHSRLRDNGFMKRNWRALLVISLFLMQGCICLYTVQVYRDKVAAAEEQFSTQYQFATELQQEKREMSNSIRALKERLQQKDERISRLKQEVSRLNETIRSGSELMEANRELLKEKTDRIHQLQSEMQYHKDLYIESRDELKKLRDRNEQSSGSLSESWSPLTMVGNAFSYFKPLFTSFWNTLRCSGCHLFKHVTKLPMLRDLVPTWMKYRDQIAADGRGCTCGYMTPEMEREALNEFPYTYG